MAVVGLSATTNFAIDAVTLRDCTRQPSTFGAFE